MNIQKTHATKKDEVKKDWYLIDADTKVLGRVATKAAELLMGKNKTYWTSNLDCGDYVVVINTKTIEVTGKKGTDKLYRTHSQFQGGLKTRTFNELHAKSPNKVLEIAIKGMLPKNRMGREMYRKLFVFSEGEHKHSAQQPKLVELN